MHLAIDIGNSAVKAGLFDDGRLSVTLRLPHSGAANADLIARFESWLAGHAVQRVAISSVVPSLTTAFSQLLEKRIGYQPLLVRHDLRLPIQIGYPRPSELGTDRIAAAVAGASLFGIEGSDLPRPVLVIDAGTAVTLNLVDAQKVFWGGLIWAGPDLVGRALQQGTASLPQIQPAPGDVTPQSTEEAIGTGLYYGFIDGVRGLVARTLASLATEPLVVASGGRGEMLSRHLPYYVQYDRDLVLRGIHLILVANPGRQEPDPPSLSSP